MRTPYSIPTAALIFAIWGAGVLSAGEFGEKTTVSFAAPVQIPGEALPAGTYVFKVIDSSTQNNVIQVFSQDERHLFATFLAVPDRHMLPTDKTVVLFEEESPSGTPGAIRALFCHGDQYGRLFVYPHTAAVAIARRTHQKVLQTRDDEKDYNKKTRVTGVDESGNSVELQDVVPANK